MPTISELSLLTTMASYSGTSVVAVDRAARVTTIIGSSCLAVAFDPQNAVGQSIDSYFVNNPDHAKRYHETLNNRPQKISFRSANGRFYEIQIVPFFDERNEICGACSFERDVTDREKTIPELEDHVGTLECLFHETDEGIYLLDNDFVIRRANATATTMHGSDGSLVGHVCYKKIFGRDEPCEFCPVVKTFKTKQPEESAYFDERTQKHLRLRSTPIFGRHTGELIGVFETFRDVSEHTHFEESLQSYISFVDDIFVSIQDGIFIIDKEYTMVKANPAMEAMYPELTPLVGKKCYVTACRDRTCEHCPATMTFKTGKSEPLTHFKKPTGTKPGVWLEHFTFPILSPFGEVTAVICIIRDVTQRKEDEVALEQYKVRLEEMVHERTRELEQSESKMRAILSGGSVPIVFADPDGTIVFVNTAFQELTGYSEQELINHHPWEQLYDAQTAANVQFRRNREALYAGEIEQHRQDIFIRRKDNETRWVDFTASAVRDSKGKRIQLIFLLLDITDRYEMMRAVEEANERTRIMLDTTPLGCTILDRNTNVLDCNLEAVKLFGLKDKQEFRDRFFELSPDYQPDGQNSKVKTAEKIKTALTAGMDRFEWMHKKLDGTPIPCEISLVRVEREEGYIVVGYFRDLREHRQMLAKMHEVDERTQIMLNAMPLCCILWDEQFRRIDCNQEAVKLFALNDKQEFLDRFSDLSPEYQPDGSLSKEQSFKKFMEAFRDGYSRFEWTHQKLDGTLIPAEITLVCVQRGSSYIVAGYIRDLRDLKKREVESERDRRRTNVLLELSQMTQQPEIEITDYTIKSAAALTDSTMGYVVLLEHAAGVLPFRSQLLDQTLSCALPTFTEAGTPHKLSPVLTECISTKKPVIHNDFSGLLGNRAFPKGHHEVRSHMNVPIMDGENPVGIIGVGNKDIPYTEADMTQLTLLAQGLGTLLNRKKYAENLERAKTEAESANKAKSEFLAHMSHEIRTPLNGVIGLSDLLARTLLNEKQSEYVQLINASGNALLFLINDILDFSKIEAGKLEISSEPFDLSATIEAVLASHAPRSSEKNLELVVTFCQNLPRIVEGDAGRVRQILINLTGNAVKFTDHGGVRIDISIESSDETTVVIKFCVIDSGIGISPSGIERLFKAFSQVDTSSARVYGGTGLGLAISMQLVRLMHGDIGVESTEGKGSTFWFKIPFKCDPHVLQCLREKRCSDVPVLDCPNIDGPYCTVFANRAIPGEYSIQKHSVLIVDDNEIQRDALSVQLKNWEMECTVCDSGEEAFQLAKEYQDLKKPFDLIIIDNTLSDGTGIELTRRLLGQEQHTVESVQIILLRSFSAECDLEQSIIDDPRIEFISKPVFASSLFDAVINRIGTAKLQEKVASGIATLDDLEESRLIVSKLRRQTESAEKSSNKPGRLLSYLEGKVHILVAEDNRVNQIVAKNLLTEAGFTCDIAQNGSEACSAVRNKKYDLILMDCQMPEMDGFEATRLIRNWEREYGSKRLPIIALTANATKDDVRKCMESGMDAYCSKPINPLVVIQQIEEWYEKCNT